jgi:hypothetical protein
MIGTDWLESHDAILNFKTKRLSLTDALGHSRVIVGRNQGGFLDIYFFPTTTKDYVQGMKDICNIGAKQKGRGGRIIKPSRDSRVCRRISKRVSRFTARKRT